MDDRHDGTALSQRGRARASPAAGYGGALPHPGGTGPSSGWRAPPDVQARRGEQRGGRGQAGPRGWLAAGHDRHAMPAPRPWTISDATPADTAALVALDQRNFPRADWFDRRLWRRILGEQAARGRMLTLVARQQGTVVGAIVGEFRPRAGRVVVWSIAVDTRERGAGLAQQLMAELVQRTPATYRQVGLDVRRDNVRARRFYERLGFHPVREIPNGYADGTDAIRYQVGLAELCHALESPGPND